MPPFTASCRRCLRRSRGLLAVLCVALLTLPAAQAAVPQMVLVLSERGGVYEAFADAFEATLSGIGENGRVRRVLASEAAPETALAGSELIVAVGVQAMRAAAGWQAAQPVLGTLVPQRAFEQLQAESGGKRRPGSLSAIWIDQPPLRLLGLFRQILPEARRAGVILGPDSAARAAALQRAAARLSIELTMETVATEAEVMPALARLLPKVDGLLAVPDSVVYRRDSVRGILLTTYRHQKPLIAFSQSYVSAGATAAVFSTPALSALQVAELVRALPPGRVSLPPPSPAAYPAIAINRQVARSLGLEPPVDALVQKAVERIVEESK